MMILLTAKYGGGIMARAMIFEKEGRMTNASAEGSEMNLELGDALPLSISKEFLTCR
jgi:hypothetical protein